MAAIVPEPFFSTAGVCQRALMSACIVTGDPTDIGTCDPAVFRLSGDDGYEIRDPGIVFVALVAGVSAFWDAVKIYRNKDSRVNFEYATVFGYFGLAMLLLMVGRCFAYDAGALTDVLLGLGLLFSTAAFLSLIFCLLGDFRVMPTSLGVRVGIELVVVVMLAAPGFVGVLAASDVLIFFGTMLVPLICAVAYIIGAIVYAAKGDEDGSYKWGFVWLAFGVPFFILAVLFTLVIGDLTCQIQATFNGALFYYVFLDAAMLFLYKFFMATHFDEIDDEQMDGRRWGCICCTKCDNR